jgi:hypothetical protein
VTRGDGGVSIIDVGSKKVTQSLNSVSVFDLKTLEVTGQISTGPGSGPGCLAWVETK